MCWYRTLGLENRSDKNRPLLETLPLPLNIPKSHPEKNPGDQKNADWLQRTHWNLPFQTSSANYKGKDMANKNRHVESTNSIFFQGLRINWEPPERGVWICFLQGSFRSPNRYWDPIILRAFFRHVKCCMDFEVKFVLQVEALQPISSTIHVNGTNNSLMSKGCRKNVCHAQQH